MGSELAKGLRQLGRLAADEDIFDAKTGAKEMVKLFSSVMKAMEKAGVIQSYIDEWMQDHKELIDKVMKKQVKYKDAIVPLKVGDLPNFFTAKLVDKDDNPTKHGQALIDTLKYKGHKVDNLFDVVSLARKTWNTLEKAPRKTVTRKTKKVSGIDLKKATKSQKKAIAVFTDITVAKSAAEGLQIVGEKARAEKGPVKQRKAMRGNKKKKT